MERLRGDSRGQATPLIVGVVAVLAVFILGLATLGRSVSDAAQARTAADAAALAGTTTGRSGAASIAVANGATLVGFEQLGTDVVVVVRVGRATARARAALNGDRPNTLDVRGRIRPPG